GVYAGLLAKQGYIVRLIDPVGRHVAEAQALATSQPEHPFSAVVGDARQLLEEDSAFDAVLLMGPLYHLLEESERQRALAEARRVARSGGTIVVTAISRFASLLDGLRFGWLEDPSFRKIVEADLLTGRHVNPQPE